MTKDNLRKKETGEEKEPDTFEKRVKFNDTSWNWI